MGNKETEGDRENCICDALYTVDPMFSTGYLQVAIHQNYYNRICKTYLSKVFFIRISRMLFDTIFEVNLSIHTEFPA